MLVLDIYANVNENQTKLNKILVTGHDISLSILPNIFSTPVIGLAFLILIITTISASTSLWHTVTIYKPTILGSVSKIENFTDFVQ